MNKDLKLKLLHAFFPNKCSSCKKIIVYNKLFCDSCFNELEILGGDRCEICFRLIENCDCNKNPKFYFRSISVYAYDNSAKKSLITLKRLKLDALFDFYAEKMAETVKKDYKAVEFDAIVPVPMYKHKKSLRGYNQSEILAKKLSQKLCVPILKNVLVQADPAKPQHTLNHKQRINNVKGIYRCSGIPIECQCVLLVDDIITSGATLNECSKMLRLDGVGKVYCITVAKTEYKTPC